MPCVGVGERVARVELVAFVAPSVPRTSRNVIMCYYDCES